MLQAWSVRRVVRLLRVARLALPELALPELALPELALPEPEPVLELQMPARLRAHVAR